MKIGIVTEYLKKNDKTYFSEEAQTFIRFIKKKHTIYFIDTTKNEDSMGFILLNHNGLHEIKYDLDLDAIYFGLVGKRIENFGIQNCLFDQLKSFISLIERIRGYETKIKFVNPINSMIYNLSKDYILKLSKKTGLPFIPTKKIERVDQLLKIAHSKKLYLAKPIISERSKGTFIINNMNDDQLCTYASKYNVENSLSFSGDPGLKDIMQGQGLLVQPFLPGFMETGEIKIAVVNGEITLTRRCIPEHKMDQPQVVVIGKGAKIVRHEITSKEKRLCLDAYHAFNHYYKAKIMRIEIGRAHV